jgi:CRP-like cAMP-binding protein
MIIKEKARRRIHHASEFMVVAASIITLLAILDIGPVHLSLYLVIGQPFFILGAACYLFVAISNFISHLGTSKIRFAPGEVIFRKGELGEFVYTIINGEVEVIDEDREEGNQVLAYLGPGEYFGEMALLSDEPRKATVRAVSPVYAMTLARGDFKSLHAYLPELGNNVNNIVSKRLG